MARASEVTSSRSSARAGAATAEKASATARKSPPKKATAKKAATKKAATKKAATDEGGDREGPGEEDPGQEDPGQEERRRRGDQEGRDHPWVHHRQDCRPEGHGDEPHDVPCPLPHPPQLPPSTTAKKNEPVTSPSPSKRTSKASGAKKAPAKKTPAKKSAAGAATKKATAKKAPAKKATAKKAPAKRSSAFDAKFLDAQKAMLLEERERLVHDAESLTAEANALAEGREPGDVQFDEESGEGDTLAVERERDLALSAQFRGQVEEIDRALAKFAEGTYGICEVSGQPIPKERLRAIPWARERVEYKVGGFGRR